MSSPLHHDSLHDLAEYRRRHVADRRALTQRRLSRRTTLQGAALLAMGSGMTAFLAACGGSSGSKNQAYAPQTAAPNASAPPLSAWKDTTDTPPYKLGLADAQVDPKWQQFPYVYKYNWRRHPFDAPLTS